MLMEMCWLIIPLLGFTQNVNTFQVNNVTDVINTSVVVVVPHKTDNSSTNTKFINNVPTAIVHSGMKASSSLGMVNKNGDSKSVTLSKTIVQNLNKSASRGNASLNIQSRTSGKVISVTKSFVNNISRTSAPVVLKSNVTKNTGLGSKSTVTKKTTSVLTASVGVPIKSTVLKKMSQNKTNYPITRSLNLAHSSVNTKALSSSSHVIMFTKNSSYSHITDKKMLATTSPISTGVPKQISTENNKTSIGNGVSTTVSSSTPISRSSSMKVLNKSELGKISTKGISSKMSSKTFIGYSPSKSSKIPTSSISSVIVSGATVKVITSQASSSSELVIPSTKITSVHVKNKSVNINVTHSTSNISKVKVHPSSSVVNGTHLPSTSKIVVMSSTPKPSSSIRATVVISTTSLAITPTIVVISTTHKPVSSSRRTVISSAKSIVKSPVKSDLPSPMSSSYYKKSTYIITSAISPTSSVEEKLQTKVVLPGLSTGSRKVPLTLAGRIGIGVAIAAGIIIIVLLIYFAKSKHKINRYRRYDNTYQIPGFTDVGGMVQLSTIGDSEYEILDATDYSRGDNPLYDLAQNPEVHTPYENHGYARNEYDGSNDTGNANNTNFTNFPTFKE